MIYSIYEEITGMADQDGLLIRNKLIEMNLGHIFDYPWHRHHPAGNFKPIVLFTAHTYSWESKMVRLGADWQKTKFRIAAKVQLPEYLYEDVCNLKDYDLSQCFMEFLHLYHDNMDYIHLTSLKELYQQVMTQSTRYQPDEAGNTDLPEKFKNIQRASELVEDIKNREGELTAKYRILQAPKNDFKYDHTEHGNPLKLENSTLIRG